MKKLIKFLESRIDSCDKLGGMEKEKWAFIQCLKEARKILLKKTMLEVDLSDMYDLELIEEIKQFNAHQLTISKVPPATEKWMWMMDYCKENQLAPALSEDWARAEKAYREHKL